MVVYAVIDVDNTNIDNIMLFENSESALKYYKYRHELDPNKNFEIVPKETYNTKREITIKNNELFNEMLKLRKLEKERNLTQEEKDRLFDVTLELYGRRHEC